ncbi:hypothetical protein DT076_06775 [Desertihabitans brevis]|uniref:Uncharacterized protein n=1 Tax=Desertihabitans brevis TaxID=2268447 RepID=A0A367YXU6_9ACTN|nr:hypothetical protein [Desertihabitans brevis]RCK70349.1 hypothetical protein DT076_06775 [Desertihabitans brevis]
MTQPAAPWLDGAPLSRDWPPPPSRRPPRWLRVGLPVGLALVLLVALLGAGGFQRRTDTTTVMAPGAVLDAGRLAYTFDRAVAEAETGSGEGRWSVTLQGTVANPTDESQPLPHRSSGELAVRGVPGDHLAELGLVEAGGPTSVVLYRTNVPPGTSLPLTISATLPPDYRPSDRLLVVVCETELSNRRVLDPDAEPQWNPTERCFAVFAPLSVRPGR